MAESRAVADMALVHADGTKERFYSVSSQIESERNENYRQLESAQRGDIDITGWLKWFLGRLKRAIDGADKTLPVVLLKARHWQRTNSRPVNDRQRLVINRMRSGFVGFLSTSKYAKLAKCSTDTARCATCANYLTAHSASKRRQRAKHELPPWRTGMRRQIIAAAKLDSLAGAQGLS